MMPDNIAVFATVILLLPMMYFFLASPSFLLVGLDIPGVSTLLRGMISGYLLMLTLAGLIGAAAVAVEGRLLLALGIGAIAACAVWSRRWSLRQMDCGMRARDLGDTNAVRRMRRLHWIGMLGNAAVLAALVACIPYVAVVPV